ncbi:serpin family protein [bacterium]|nr:serpin family protein [bacterium]
MKKVSISFMMLLLLVVLANCNKKEQVEVEFVKEVTPQIVQETEKEISPEEVQQFLKEFDSDSDSDMDYSISEANNKLSVILFKMLDKDNENLIFSSFSISNALAMTAETTNEEISNSIRSGLRLPNDTSIIRKGYQSILANYGKENKEYALNIANAVWVDKKYSLESERQKNIEKYYLGQAISFDNLQPVVTANQVNEWCDKKTNGMIKKIINAGDIHGRTHLILTNAIYFKGSWEEEFQVYNTSQRTFYNSAEQESQVDFMNINEKFAYTEDDNVQVLKMNYRGGDLSMIVILPRENDIRALKDSLKSEMLAKWNNNLDIYEVEVHFPKFKFDFDAELNEVLKKIGMDRAFVGKTADELYIDKVLHRAIIDVNEAGTEAAAVTGVFMTDGMSPQYEKRKFIADHPFIFVIQDDRNQNILFMGKVEYPVYKD